MPLSPPKKIKEAVKSAVIDEDRLYNFMMYGVEELDEDDPNDEDKLQITGRSCQGKTF